MQYEGVIGIKPEILPEPIAHAFCVPLPHAYKAISGEKGCVFFLLGQASEA
jgi:hypothetical protein